MAGIQGSKIICALWMFVMAVNSLSPVYLSFLKKNKKPFILLNLFTIAKNIKMDLTVECCKAIKI